MRKKNTERYSIKIIMRSERGKVKIRINVSELFRRADFGSSK